MNIESLCNEFCQENDIMIEESAKDFLNKIGQAAKAGSDKVAQGFKSLGEKVTKLKEFIKDIMNKAIKSAKELVEKIALEKNIRIDAIITPDEKSLRGR